MRSGFRFGILALVWLVTANHNDAGPTPVEAQPSGSANTKTSEHANRLAHEKSPTPISTRTIRWTGIRGAKKPLRERDVRTSQSFFSWLFHMSLVPCDGA